MPYVASTGTHVPRRTGTRRAAEVHVLDTGSELVKYESLGIGEGLRGLEGFGTRRSDVHRYRLGVLDSARNGLPHNTVGSAAVSAVTILEGAAHGAG